MLYLCNLISYSCSILVLGTFFAIFLSFFSILILHIYDIQYPDTLFNIRLQTECNGLAVGTSPPF